MTTITNEGLRRAMIAAGRVPVAWVTPPGYEVVETNEVISVQRAFLTRRGARKYVLRYPPIIPSYRLKVERRHFLRWEVVACQNIMRAIVEQVAP